MAEKKTRTRKPIPPRKPGDPYTVEEAAAALRISIETIYAACRSGELVAMRFGTPKRGIWRIEPADFDDYRERAKAKPGRIDSLGRHMKSIKAWSRP